MKLPKTLTSVTPLSKTVAAILFITLPFLGFSLGIEFQKSLTRSPSNITTPSQPDEVACTMDAKLCPDGSSVGRIPPDCEFAECPKTVSKQTFIGTVKSDAQLRTKYYCSNGLYLVADEGTYLVNQTIVLLLRRPVESGETDMFTDTRYIDQKVQVIGKYPVQGGFCEAMICGCEDYILVDHISNLTPVPDQSDWSVRGFGL